MTTLLPLRSAPFALAASLALAACSATSDALPDAGVRADASAPDAASPADDAIFVSPIGDDAAMGTRQDPVRTFARAIELARGGSRRLALCAGLFREPLALTAANGADGFAVFGSEGCQGLSPSRTIVRTEGRAALEVFAVGGPIVVADVDFARADAASPGESAIAATIAFADDVVLERVALRAGAGLAGASGTTVAVDPCDEPIDPRVPTHVGHTGEGARRVGALEGTWEPGAGASGGVLRFPRSSRCIEPSVFAGAGGAGGGASLALVVRSAHVTLAGCTLEASAAGDGGHGGNAQTPSCDPLTQKSCEVLDIGGGGGGAGGVSAAILHRQALFDIDPATKLLFGAPGQGGLGGSGARWLHGTPGLPGTSGTLIGAELFDDAAPDEHDDDDRR